MRPRPAFYVLLALGVGATIWRMRPLKVEPAPMGGQQLLVAAIDLPAGALLTSEALGTRLVDGSTVFASNLTAASVGDVVGKRLKFRLSTGEPLRVQDVGTKDPIGPVVKRGRAAVIDVDAHRALDGRLEAGDHVDVLVTLKDPQINEPVTMTMAENVVVLGVTHRQAPEQETLTLLVLEQEAESLMLAQEAGKVGVSLRNPEDSEPSQDLSRASISSLISGYRRQEGCRMHSSMLQVIRNAETAKH